MNLVELFGGPWGPLLIFCLRIVDVSAATSRVLLAVRGDRFYVPIIGFFESMIWIFAVGAAIQSLNSPLHVLGYAGGFATGNVVGLWFEEKMALGLSTVRIISRHGGVELAEVAVWDPEAFVTVESPKEIRRGWMMAKQR